MQKTITLEVADDEFSQANEAALQAGFEINEYLNIVVKAMALPQTVNEDIIERIFHLLPDEMVMNLAKIRMAKKESKQHSRLLEKRGEGKLKGIERDQLTELTEEYERGTIRKAYAMAEAVRRGLMPPVQS